MYNLLLASVLGLVTFAGITAGLGWVAAIVPALAVALLAMFLLARRTGQQVQIELAGVPVLLQQRRIDEAQTKLVHVRDRYKWWQFLLEGQIDAQLGMIDYLQLKFDDARPKLESGKWRNGIALACIAAIDWRRGRKDEAWKGFAAAAQAAKEDPTIYLVWSTLLARDGDRAAALAAVDAGIQALPNNAQLKELKGKIANKQKVDPKSFGEGWFQYFPEDYAQQMMMRGTRTPSPMFGQNPQAPRPGARHAPRR
ncbi:MAG: hypothetical protein ABMA64_04745 [Myxococcota bacterium]